VRVVVNVTHKKNAAGGGASGRYRAARYMKTALPAVLLTIGARALGQPDGPMGAQRLDWSNGQISEVIAGGSPVYFPGRITTIEGKKCLIGSMFHINVRDEYAFDIDETVELEVEFRLQTSRMKVGIFYDKNGATFDANAIDKMLYEPNVVREIVVPALGLSGRWHKQGFILNRARFANSGFSGTDLLIYGQPERPDENNKSRSPYDTPEMVICGISLVRSDTSPKPSAYGQLLVEAADGNNRPTSVRLGIYNDTGRSPLPGDEAIPLRSYNNVSRVVALRVGSIPWPSENRSAFYIYDRYHARLPVGDYELIAAKGPEYHVEQHHLTVKTDGTLSIKLKMQRWDDMAAKGWYSGDGHIHYTRDSTSDDRNLLRFIEAEDLHVANVLQMGNSGNAYFRQYSWRTMSDPNERSFALIPGQEDPRTIRHGHTMQLHLEQPIRDPSRYLLYHEIFQRSHAKGGVTGYAHVRDGIEETMGVRRGMALDMPFGLVDFAEVMQWGNVNTETWFDFLNLGYKLTPSAGSDYPYIDVPGAVRNYVHLEKRFTPQAWLDGLKAGRTFVTNGPILEFTVNGRSMGSELHMKSGEALVIGGKARINPDIDRLDRLELIEQGDIVKAVSSPTGSQDLSFRYEIPATHGTWFVLRAHGKQEKKHGNVVAMSAPIYVEVNGQSFRKLSAVPTIVTELKQELHDLLKPPSEQFEIESWDTQDPDSKYWNSQRALLEKRVAEVTALYDELLVQPKGQQTAKRN